jgi:hypothetical protein
MIAYLAVLIKKAAILVPARNSLSKGSFKRVFTTKYINMGIGFNQPTTKYAQKAGPRENFWTGRGVE